MPVKKVIPGYPIYPGGSKKLSIFDYKGLATYAPGGDSFYAKELGEGGIDALVPVGGGAVGLTFSGTYFVVVKFPATTIDDAIDHVTISWWVVATGLECGAIDLSAEVVRLMGIFV
jgi:hypothetical protein